MKKIFAMLLATIILSANLTSALAEEYWSVINKDTLPAISGTQVGNYFFKGDEKDNLLYSTDGINFSRVPGIDTETIVNRGYFPPSYTSATYSHGLYFVVDDFNILNMPQSKIPSGISNTPMYVLDENLNIINMVDGRFWVEYDGYYNGYHYIGITSYINGNSMPGWTSISEGQMYKTIDGINLTEVEVEELKEVPEFDGLGLFDGSVIKTTTYEDTEIVKYYMNGNSYKILQENDGFVRRASRNNHNKLLELSYKIGETTHTTDYNARTYRQSIIENRLSLDGIYGVVMPENIGTYRFELNGNYYFDIKDDETSYYCIPKSALTDKIKVVYGDSILAFDVAPVTESNRTLVPMRFLFEQMGAEVAWNADTNTATVTKGEDVISFSIDNTNASVNGEVKTMDVPARLIENKTMIPVRFLSEELGYIVGWDEETKIVTISDN